MMPVGAPTKAFSACWVSGPCPRPKPSTGEFVQGGDDGAFDRVRGGQPGAERDVGIEQEVEAGDLDAVLLQRPDHAEWVLGPAGDVARRQGGDVGLHDAVVAEGGQQPDGASRRGAGRADRGRLSIAKGRTKPSL